MQNKNVKEHKLKILPEYFNKVITGEKTFEIRKNDRNFQVGDYILLQEFFEESYTDREQRVKITYITNYAQQEDYVVMSVVVSNTKDIEFAVLDQKINKIIFTGTENECINYLISYPSSINEENFNFNRFWLVNK